jgi:phospholipid/cholesterol/gamma-HCH transport system substrate-binding protein
MTGMLKEHGAEALIGLLVILAAVWFVTFAYGRSDGGSGASYEITARFPNATGVTSGTDVRVSGLKVGSVAGSSLDPETFQAVVTLSVEERVKLPIDTSAAITSEGILGGTYISLMPGGDPETLKPGDEIIDTQGSTDLMGLIGSVINRTGGEGGSSSDGGGAGLGSAEPAGPGAMPVSAGAP